MKDARNQMLPQNKQGMTKIPKPEIRDDLDSRKNEEQFTKGNDVSHNKKDHRNTRQKKQ